MIGAVAIALLAVAAQPEAVDGGDHWRVMILGAPVHVYRPKGFDPRTGGIVLYAHGYFDDVDSAWATHKLDAQFKKSGRNALFIATEAPSKDEDKVQHWHLGWLLREVFRATGLTEPEGETVAVAHSGGYRVIIEWIKRHSVDEVVLIDGLYNNESDVVSWLKGGGGARRLTLVSIDTAYKADTFMAKLDKKTLSKVIDVRPVVDHMGVITGGRVLPEVISCTRLEPLVTTISER